MSILPDALRDLEVGDFLSFGLVLFFIAIFLFHYVFFFQVFRIFRIILDYIIDFLGTLNSRASSFGVASLATNRAMANDFDSFLWSYLSNNFLCSIGTSG